MSVWALSKYFDISTDKSGKKFAPKKAPVRRPTGPESSQGSARHSVDRHTQSQTPQPQPVVRHLASSPAQSQTLIPPTIVQGPTQSAQAAPSRDIHAIQIQIQSRSTPTQSGSSPSAAIPHRQPSDCIANAGPSISSVTQSPSSTSAPADVSARRTRAQWQRSSISQPAGNTRRDQESEPFSTGPVAPAAKRRKLEKAQADVVSAVSHAVGPNVPLPTTEIDEAVAESGPNQNESLRPEDVRQGKAKNSTDLVINPRTKKASGMPASQSGPTIQDDVEGGRTEVQDQDAQAHSQPQRTRHRRSKKQTVQDAAAEIVGDAVQKSRKDPKRRGRRSKRSETPEDAENIRIAPSEMRMMELCRDGGIGRKSLREQELREMDRVQFVKKKQGELQDLMREAVSPPQNGPIESRRATERREDRQRERDEEITLNVPNTIIVNGQIQIDEESLQIDRHAAAAVLRNIEELDPIDENDLSRKVTSGSWLKRDKSGGWNEILLDRFYRGLRMFGTDFEMISMMFPGKTRHAIKLKFCREEKLDYPRIKAALMGEKLPVNLEEYEHMTGVEYEHPEELEKLMDEDRRRLEDEQIVEKQAMEDAIKEREAQAAVEREAAGDESGKESKKKRSKKRTKEGKGKKRERMPRNKQLGLGGFAHSAGEETSRAPVSATA